MKAHSVYSPPQSEIPSNRPKPADPKTIPLDTLKVDFAASRLAGYAVPQPQKTVALVLMDTDTVFTVQVADRILIGRRDIVSNGKLDIDLAEHGGRVKGVSRCHAALLRHDYTLSIEDLNSMNGTYVNGVGLLPNQPHDVRDGDEIRLGKLRFHIHFAC